MLFDPMILVVISANLLGAAMAAPQALKLRRTRRPDGVSVPWAAISATVNAWWGVYGIGVGDWGIVPVSIVSVLAYLTITYYLVRLTGSNPRRLLPAAASVLAISAVPVATLVLSGWTTTGLVLGTLYGIQLAPAVVAVYRVVDVAGVSLATWLIAFAEAALWGVYGFSRLDLGLLALSITGLFMSSLVLARLFVRRPRRAGVRASANLPGFAAA